MPGMAPPAPDGLDTLSLSRLGGFVGGLIGKVHALTDKNRTVRDEVARLNGLPPRPPRCATHADQVFGASQVVCETC